RGASADGSTQGYIRRLILPRKRLARIGDGIGRRPNDRPFENAKCEVIGSAARSAVVGSQQEEFGRVVIGRLVGDVVLDGVVVDAHLIRQVISSRRTGVLRAELHVVQADSLLLEDGETGGT